MYFKFSDKLRKRIDINFIFFGLLFFVTFTAGVFLFSLLLSGSAVSAVSGNYNKAISDSLLVSDWNNLPADFADKQGDTMTGPLVLSGNPSQLLHAATKEYVDNEALAITDPSLSGEITDLSGNELRMVCDRTVPGATDWAQYASNRVFVTVNTASAGFTATPIYLASLGGSTNHDATFGVSSIYTPSSDGFSVIVTWRGGNVTAAQANSRQWHIIWCAIGK